MKRGDIFSIAAHSAFGTKPRPGMVLQSSYFDALRTVTIVPFTSQSDNAPDLRVPVNPTVDNALRVISFAMIDSVTTVRNEEVGGRIGSLDRADLERLERAILIFLGFHG